MSEIELLTYGEAAALLKVHYNTIKRWCDAGTLTRLYPPVGRTVRLDKAEVLNAMTARREVTT